MEIFPESVSTQEVVLEGGDLCEAILEVSIVFKQEGRDNDTKGSVSLLEEGKTSRDSSILSSMSQTSSLSECKKRHLNDITSSTINGANDGVEGHELTIDGSSPLFRQVHRDE